MTRKAGSLIGFVLGTGSFLVLYKLFVLDSHSRADELAPGIVLIAAVMNGLLFAIAGHSTQRYLMKKNKTR